MQEPVPGIQAIPDEQNARYFHVVVAGPEGVSNGFIQVLFFLYFQLEIIIFPLLKLKYYSFSET